MGKIAYGAWVKTRHKKHGDFLVRLPEERVREVLLLEFPDELVDRVIDRLHRQVERELRRL